MAAPLFYTKSVQIYTKSTTMNKQILEKRKLLQTLSHAATETAQDLGVDPSELKINDLLMQYIYNPENEFSFNSFVGWKNEGYTIKKGAKAFLLWGQPINRTRTDQDGTTKEANEEEESEPPFFPLAYVFRSDQVLKPLRQKKEKKPKPMEVSTPAIELDL